MNHLLDKWRHLIEPVIAESTTPVAWSTVLSLDVLVFESENSVLVTRDGHLFGEPVRMVWVAAGEMSEVDKLIREVEQSARIAGIGRVAFFGRRGWIRSQGYRECAVLGVKEI